MGYQIIEPIIDASNIKPLGVSLSSCNTPIYLTNDQAYENLKTLLLTRKGERYNQPLFGTLLLNILFEPNSDIIKDRVQDIIRKPVAYWLPYIDIEDIDIITHEDDPNVNYNIQITISFSVGQYNATTITFTATEEGNLEVS